MANKSNHLFDRIVHFIVYKGHGIEKVFLLLTIICTICFPFVGVNYDLSKYLPQSAPTKQALDVMEEEFGYPGMARIMLKNTTMTAAKDIRQRVADVDGVSLVVGADVLSDVYMGNGFVQNDLTDEFYKDGNAVMEVIFEDGDSDPSTRQALNKIYQICGDDACYSGSAVSSQKRESAITREIAIAIVIALFIIWAILTLTTTSWFEPFLFLLVMIVAILLNMGSNIIFGTISFFTFSTSAILQLAVSMDYSIFLLHTFTAHKQEGMDVHQAMELSIKEASSSILASGATTIVGFLAIALMEFTIGRDVGFVLTKGILCSLATVLLLMPTLILRFDKRIERTQHRPLIPSFDPLARAMHKIRWPVLVISLLLAVPCYFGQDMNKFFYGDEAVGAGPGTEYYEDTQAINEVFGKSNVAIAMVPNGSAVTERELTTTLEDLPFTNYALSLSGVLPEGIPEDFLPSKIVSQLRTDHYARFLISMATNQESDYAFECESELEKAIKEYYPEDSYVIGMTASTVDIRDILTQDYSRVSILSLIGVAIVVMLTFRSILIPIFVIIPIEVAIYLNMTIPFIMGESVIYICYIIVSCLQLGATIDYSILMTNNYLSARQTLSPQDSARTAIGKSTLSILTSGSILMVVGYLLYFTSTIQAISQTGRLVGRGAILSMLLVLSLLPALLSAFDKPIMNGRNRAQARRAKRQHRTHELQTSPSGATVLPQPKNENPLKQLKHKLHPHQKNTDSTEGAPQTDAPQTDAPQSEGSAATAKMPASQTPESSAATANTPAPQAPESSAATAKTPAPQPPESSAIPTRTPEPSPDADNTKFTGNPPAQMPEELPKQTPEPPADKKGDSKK